MAAGDVYRLLIVWTNSTTGEDLSSSLHGTQPALLAPSITAVGDDVKAWWDTSLNGNTAQKAWHPTEVELARVTLRRVDPIEPVEQLYTTGLPIAGTDTTDPLPGQNAILVSKRTAFIGRSYRGRAYLPPPAEAVVQPNGSLLLSTAEDIASQYLELIASLTVDNFVPIVWGHLPGPPPSTVESPITSILVDRLLRTQRRRADDAAVYGTGS